MTKQMAVDRYVGQFEAFAANGGGTRTPTWLKALRSTAIRRFAEVGFPHTKQEAWRFTSVTPLVDTPFALTHASDDARRLTAEEIRPYLLGGIGHTIAVFVNGHFVEGLSSVGNLPAGVKVGSLARALAEEPDLIERHLGKYAQYQDSAFTALNTAFAYDGALVHVPASVRLAEPIQLVFLSSPGAEKTVSHPRNLVVVEREGRADVVETYGALGGGAGVYWTNAVTEVVVGEGARCDSYRVNRESEHAFHIATTQSWQARDSVVWHHGVVLGSALSRHELKVVLDGTGAEATLNGLYVLHGRQHVDHHTTIDHAQPRCASHEYFNGVLDDASHGVFTGRIIVRKGAVGTDSKQTNNNLVLSHEARADSQPQLEIYADDVKCTHGATLGPIDERQMFYLKSRGLSTEDARNLLTYGFGAEILFRMGLPGLHHEVDLLVRRRLADGAAKRRAERSEGAVR
jgi:Fe-S cluster assembly protein SufD